MSRRLKPVVVDGSSLTLEQVVRVARQPALEVVCPPEALDRVAAGRLPIEPEQLQRCVRRGAPVSTTV